MQPCVIQGELTRFSLSLNRKLDCRDALLSARDAFNQKFFPLLNAPNLCASIEIQGNAN